LKVYFDVEEAVISVTLFLIAMTDICKGMEEPTEMTKYADDWIIYTKPQTTKSSRSQT
jgi:hypothetical protein